MHIWTELITREAVLLVILAVLGSGPAAFLPPRFDTTSRIALAPAFGLALGTCVMTTVLNYEPARTGYWVLPLLAVLSASVAAIRLRRNGRREWPALGLRDAAQLLLVCFLVSLPLTLTLHEQFSVGPVAWSSYDAAGYVQETDGLAVHGIREARHAPPTGDLTVDFWDGYAQGFQNLDAAPLEASVNTLIGLHATDTQSPFLIILLVVGALGAFAAVRYLTASRTWAAALSGALFAGPVFVQLWFASSQAAISGLAVLMALAIVGVEELRQRRLANLVLFAILGGGLLALYPLFVPAAAVCGAAAIIYMVVRRTDGQRRVGSGANRILFVIGLMIVLSPVAFVRDVNYWRAVLNGSLALTSLPHYQMPIQVLPSWLLQMGEIAALPDFTRGGLRNILVGALLPLTPIALIAIGLKRRTAARGLLVLLAICSLLALYVSLKDSCTYCADRNLLPLAPAGAVLIGLGVWSLMNGSRRSRGLGLLATALIVIPVAERTRIERERAAHGSSVLDSSNRVVLSHLPRTTSAVQMEGYSENVLSPGETPFIYTLLEERLQRRVSLSVEQNDNSSLAYVTPPKLPGPEFHADYGYVLTRMAGIATNRRVLARSGGIALEQRTADLDVTPISGLGVPLSRLNPQGAAYVVGSVPLQFLITGGAGVPRAWIRLTFHAAQAIAVPPQPGVSAVLKGDTLTVCAPAAGRAPIRRLTLGLSFSALPYVPAKESFGIPQPPEGISLTSMRAGPSCSLTNP
ncbi:MAG: hypothetical protein NVSMB51_21420 [Solirubrobacteraceae bacterium]